MGREVFLQKEKLGFKSTFLVGGFSMDMYLELGCRGTRHLLSHLLSRIFPASGQQVVQKLVLKEFGGPVIRTGAPDSNPIFPQILKVAGWQNIGPWWSSPLFIDNINQTQIYFLLKVVENKAALSQKLSCDKMSLQKGLLHRGNISCTKIPYPCAQQTIFRNACTCQDPQPTC